MKTKLREMIITMCKSSLKAIRFVYAVAICLIMLTVICDIVGVPGIVIRIFGIAMIFVVLMLYVMYSISQTPNYILRKNKLEDIVLSNPNIWYFMFCTVAIITVAEIGAVNNIGSAIVVGFFIGCICVITTDPIAKWFKKKIKR